MNNPPIDRTRPRVFAIVQARMGSTRCRGKVLQPLAGRPILHHLLDRLRAARELTGIVVATTTQTEDRAVTKLAQEAGIPVFTGSVEDVLGRFVGAAQMVQANVIARITADCPLIDPATVDGAVRFFLSNKFDIVDEGPGKVLPRGLDVSVFSMQALLRANALAQDGPSREHVTLYMYRHPETFCIGYYPVRSELRHPEWRLCVDEEPDFRLLEAIYTRLWRPGQLVAIEDVARLVQREPELLAINAHVQQKAV